MKFIITNMETLSADTAITDTEEIDLPREEEGRGNKPMETRQTNHTANFSA